MVAELQEYLISHFLDVYCNRINCKELIWLLEKKMKRDLEDYHGFLNQKILEIEGQIKRPSQIFKYLYLVGVKLKCMNAMLLLEEYTSFVCVLCVLYRVLGIMSLSEMMN